jgi:hypothetical protein
MVDGSLVGCFNNTTLAHQMPQASAVHHITVIPGEENNVKLRLTFKKNSQLRQ